MFSGEKINITEVSGRDSYNKKSALMFCCCLYAIIGCLYYIYIFVLIIIIILGSSGPTHRSAQPFQQADHGGWEGRKKPLVFVQKKH